MAARTLGPNVFNSALFFKKGCDSKYSAVARLSTSTYDEKHILLLFELLLEKVVKLSNTSTPETRFSEPWFSDYSI